jgi:S1-C subfamily serine protease
VNGSHLGPRQPAASSSSGRVATTLFRSLEVLALAALVFGYVTLSRREDEVRDQHRALEARAAAVNSRLDEIQKSSGSEMRDLRTSLVVAGEAARAREDMIRDALDRTSAALGVQERKLTQLTGIQEERFAKSESALGERIEQLSAQLASEKLESSRPTGVARFRAIQELAEESVYLLHCVFTYETKEFDDDWKEHQATTWGTAFAVSDDGFLITNKHLVMPWKFDSELGALKAMGEVRIKEDSLRLAAWPVGASCLDDFRKANFKAGYSSDRGTLSLVSISEDTFNEKSVEMGGKTVKYKAHALDNHDLALLRVKGATKALKFAANDPDGRLKKLDPVMAIGFPRGVGGLESTVAIPSATLGAIRKVEDTVHISAPIVAGNSGGPVFSEDGQVIGVATRIYCETLGICIKAEHARTLLDRARLADNVASMVPVSTR